MLLEDYSTCVHFFPSLNVFKYLGQLITCPKKVISICVTAFFGSNYVSGHSYSSLLSLQKKDLDNLT